jgi:hypothetical protein
VAAIYGLSPLGVSVFVKLLRLIELKAVNLDKIVLIEGAVGEVVTGEHIEVHGFLSQNDLWKSVARKLKGKFSIKERLVHSYSYVEKVRQNISGATTWELLRVLGLQLVNENIRSVYTVFA